MQMLAELKDLVQKSIITQVSKFTIAKRRESLANDNHNNPKLNEY